MRMTLTRYAQILDRVVMSEAGWVCADKENVYMFVRRPVFVEEGKTSFRWEGACGNKPVLITRYNPGDLDLSEFTDEDGDIDWSACRVKL